MRGKTSRPLETLSGGCENIKDSRSYKCFRLNVAVLLTVTDDFEKHLDKKIRECIPPPVAVLTEQCYKALMGELRSVDLVDAKKAREVCQGQYPSIGTRIGSYVNQPKFRAKGLEALLSLCNPDPNAPRPELPGSSDDEEGDAEATS